MCSLEGVPVNCSETLAIIPTDQGTVSLCEIRNNRVENICQTFGSQATLICLMNTCMKEYKFSYNCKFRKILRGHGILVKLVFES